MVSPPLGRMILTRRLTACFAGLAIGNEVIWRTMSTDTWVKFKVFGIMPLTMGFMLTQLGLIKRRRQFGQVIRDVDIGGRYGGDEYIIILPETDEQGALALSRRLHTIIKRRTYNDGHNKIKITLSQGIGVMHGATTRLVSGKDLIRQADKALYEAKELGRDLIMVRNEKGTRKEPGNAS